MERIESKRQSKGLSSKTVRNLHQIIASAMKLAKEQKLITLDEYIEKMPEGQKAIYFAAGDEAARLGKLPNAQLVLSKGYDLLLCSEDVDEFCLQIMHDYKERNSKTSTPAIWAWKPRMKRRLPRRPQPKTRTCLRRSRRP